MGTSEQKWGEEDGENARALENLAAPGNTRLLGAAWPRTSLHNR